MNRRQFALLAALLVGAVVLTNLGFRKRQALRTITQWCEGTDRFVDVSVRLVTVKADPGGEQLLDGKPRMVVLRSQDFGGIVDTRLERPELVEGPSRSPRVWYASQDQEGVVLHADPQRLGQLVYGSEGAGKTRALAMWHYFRWLEVLGERREGGQTAPTENRLELVLREMQDVYAPNWFRYLVGDRMVLFCDGTRIRLVSTYRKSAAQGSPIQGFNWSWCGRDEAQDQIEVHEDIESRGRSARNGKYPQLATATAKDNTEWRNMRDVLLASGQWERRQLSIFRSPFIDPGFLATKKASISEREFRRRYGAEDLPPERAVYPAYSREHNLVRIPDIGWEDVTQRELARWGHGLQALVGHDPGSLYDVSLILKAYQKGARSRPFWVVVDEITTEQSTTEQHVARLLGHVREHWGLNRLTRDGKLTDETPRMLVRADPYGNTDNKTDRTCYTIFRNAGILIHPAAYAMEGLKPGRVPKNEGIEVVNTLLCNASGERRLFIAIDQHGRPCAPQLVKAIESSERDLDGKAETQRKDKHDMSHWTASLRYALWAVERPRLQAIAGGRA